MQASTITFKEQPDKDILVNGGLRVKKGRTILTVYYTPFSRYLLKKKISFVNLVYKNGIFILKRGKERKVNIERKSTYPLAVIGVSKDLLNHVGDKKGSVKVSISGFLVEFDKFNKKLNHAPVKFIKRKIPEGEQIKVACHVSCFSTKKSASYRIYMRHKLVETVVRQKKKFLVVRNKRGEFILCQDKDGRLLNLHKNKSGRVYIYMQISKDILTPAEKALFKNGGRKTFSSRLVLSKKEFNINIAEFFATWDERKLANTLLKRKVNIRIPEMHKREGDIVLINSGAQIEITQINPRREATHHNSAHTDGVHINARMCEGYVRVKKGLTPIYFLVFSKNWLKYKWVGELAEMVSPHVACISTDFSSHWDRRVVREIKTILLQRGLQ